MEEIAGNDNVQLSEKSIIKQPLKFFSTDWKFNVVNDQNAPALYSRKAIYFFTSFFSVVFGGILMSINLKKVNRKDAIWIVLVYSVAYVVAQVLILSQFKMNGTLTLVVSMIGSFALYNFFWKKYIGIETKYRTKQIWIPLIIGVGIFSLLLLAAVSDIQ